MSALPPTGPFTKDIDPTVCIGEATPCGVCRNCTMPQGWYVSGEVGREIDRLRAKAKAPMAVAETVASLTNETAFVDTWEHVSCMPPRCPHDQTLSWYQTPHCYECTDPWPCSMATLVCARVWLEALSPIVPHVDVECPACGRSDAHLDRKGREADLYEAVLPHQWPVVGAVPSEEFPS